MWIAALLAVLVQDPAESEDGLAPLIRAHCAECHSAPRPKGDLDLSAWLEPAPPEDGAATLARLERVRERLVQGEMPPPARPRPSAAELDRALDWLDARLPAPPRPALRRLNRSQYERTVRDLFGVGYPTRELFPADDVGALFDNDAAVASASELAVERWIEAAERIAARALPPLGESRERAFAADELEAEGKVARHGERHSMFSSGLVRAHFDVPRESRYRIDVLAYGERAGDELPRLAFECDGRSLAERRVRAQRAEPGVLSVTASLDAGEHALAVRFLNDFFDPGNPDPERRDRNAHVLGVSVTGPLDPPRANEWLDAAAALESLEEAVAALALRVWRRPAEPAEVARLCALGAAGAPPRERLRSALAGMLASPHFLYRVETTPAGEALSGHELATRLSYFLWASAPDPALLELAASGLLADPAVYAGEIRRLLRDARSRSLVEEFAAQWLGWRALELAAPDRKTFPTVDAALLASMRQESEAFFEALLREDRPLAEFLDADFTFLDGPLARHYGIEGVEGEGLRRVHLADRERGGLLGQAAILTATSNPTRTSPVKRGKWILETLLGSPVPPPPPGVGALEEPGAGAAPKTLREQLELHRSQVDCASCHGELDPLGFALEGFDAVGRRRTHDEQGAIDTRATLASGESLAGVRDLKRHLAAQGSFPRALARALFTYAVGRAPERGEAGELDELAGALPPGKRTLAGVIELVCNSRSFTHAEARRP